MSASELREINRCEVCESDRLTPVLDLGLHPLCDDLVPVGDTRVCAEYPIEILFCDRCRTAHQRFQLGKRELFPSTYHYRSRFTADVVNGMRELVKSCEKSFGSLAGKKILDLGCNDGSLLDFFRDRGATTLGVEPTDAALDAAQKGHVIFQEYLSKELAQIIVAAHGQPDFIIFTNVFAHIEKLGEVIGSLQVLCGPHTITVIENHYLGAILEGGQFDTFYHEHSRTYSYNSFVYIAKALGVQVIGAEFPRRYGGNIRVFLGPSAASRTSRLAEVQEDDFLPRFAELREKVARWRKAEAARLFEEAAQFGKFRAKAFPARAAILIKLLGLNEETLSAVYEKPGSLKIGHYVPGTRIPIRSDDELFALPKQTRPLLNLAWHIPQEIREYLTARGYDGPVVDILHPEDLLTQRSR